MTAARVLLSVEDAAARLTISRTRMYALLRTGEISSIRIGRLRRIPTESVEAFVLRLVSDQNAA